MTRKQVASTIRNDLFYFLINEYVIINYILYKNY